VRTARGIEAGLNGVAVQLSALAAVASAEASVIHESRAMVDGTVGLWCSRL
jgi:hypothetical protein